MSQTRLYKIFLRWTLILMVAHTLVLLGLYGFTNPMTPNKDMWYYSGWDSKNNFQFTFSISKWFNPLMWPIFSLFIFAIIKEEKDPTIDIIVSLVFGFVFGTIISLEPYITTYLPVVVSIGKFTGLMFGTIPFSMFMIPIKIKQVLLLSITTGLSASLLSDITVGLAFIFPCVLACILAYCTMCILGLIFEQIFSLEIWQTASDYLFAKEAK